MKSGFVSGRPKSLGLARPSAISSSRPRMVGFRCGLSRDVRDAKLWRKTTDDEREEEGRVWTRGVTALRPLDVNVEAVVDGNKGRGKEERRRYFEQEAQ